MAYYLFKITLPSRYLSKCCLSNKSSNVSKLLSTIIVDMHTLVTYFRKILEICKHFAGNHVMTSLVLWGKRDHLNLKCQKLAIFSGNTKKNIHFRWL